MDLLRLTPLLATSCLPNDAQPTAKRGSTGALTPHSNSIAAQPHVGAPPSPQQPTARNEAGMATRRSSRLKMARPAPAPASGAAGGYPFDENSSDLYQTPQIALDALASVLVLPVGAAIVDPFPEHRLDLLGRFSRMCMGSFHVPKATTTLDDFFSVRRFTAQTIVITNPPWSLLQDVLDVVQHRIF